MAKVGAQRAAELTGVSKSTVQRAMNNGKLSFELDPNGRRVVDASELDRVFGLQSQSGNGSSAASASSSIEKELEKASTMLEMERMKMRVQMLEKQVESLEGQLEDLRAQRDQWQKQASQVLLTSQYSQKQAEELAVKVKQQEALENERRAKMEARKLEYQMKKLKAENQNAASDDDSESGEGVLGQIGNLWKRAKGQ